jgi:hypothetical protein
VASIEIASGWVDAVQRYVDGLMADAVLAAENATEFFHEQVVARARDDEHWSSMADNIEVWSNDGQLVIGVQHPMFASQAMLLEYGDLEAPPNPLFRTLSSATRDAAKHMQDEMDSKYGPSMDVGAPKLKGMTYGR